MEGSRFCKVEDVCAERQCTECQRDDVQDVIVSSESSRRPPHIAIAGRFSRCFSAGEDVRGAFVVGEGA